MNIVAKTAWDTFYEQVWRIRCEKVNKWEKKEGITGKMKKEAGGEKKNKKEKRKVNQQKLEEKKQ
jgi:hypothetical protein